MRRPVQEDSALTSAQQVAADAGAKGMMPFGRPFLDYVISSLADAGITSVVLVVAPDADAIREYFTVTHPPTRVSVHFAVQELPRGTADAVLAARDAVGNAPFLVLNSDNLYPVEACRALAVAGGAGLVAFDADVLVRESGIDADRVLRYALLDIDDNNELTAIVEKPAADHVLATRATRWVSMNLWAFTPRIFDACTRVTPSARGELELADAVMLAIRDLGERFHVVRMREAVLDLSSRADIAGVARRLGALMPVT
jgi:UDP-N-acetylglucosamine diphosphorylase / glucose-1-phosphate thymidylyltransferase / UDP-N-acetylgalactosamine diphosphorylase / glucosamine-1-phosphate N-acetyltransferase / galactosamine-1-phosphate N-acetyltransferase